jgi:hypothetical protein
MKAFAWARILFQEIRRSGVQEEKQEKHGN